MSVRAGLLRHRVRIEEYVNVLDTSGEPIRGPQGEFVKQWALVKEVWAAIEPLSAREFMQSAAMQDQITARIVIRYMDGVTADMRLVHKRYGREDVVYNPQGFLADKESGIEYLTIPVSAGINDGQAAFQMVMDNP